MKAILSFRGLQQLQELLQNLKLLTDIKIFKKQTMKKIFSTAILISLSIVSFSQKGSISVRLTGEVAVPFFQNDQGFGVSLKTLFGIGKNDQLTLAGGISQFTKRNAVENGKTNTRLIPLLFGYRKNIERVYIEPKIGIGELGGKFDIGGDYSRPSVAAFFAGIDGGYRIKRIDVGVNFITTKGIENKSAGLWYNKTFHYTSFFIGYRILK
jgi:hypothetical protein